jgi:hypothetical protein
VHLSEDHLIDSPGRVDAFEARSGRGGMGLANRIGGSVTAGFSVVSRDVV